MTDVALWVLVAVAGAAGALLRWAVAERLPAGVFVVNVGACLALGVLTGLAVVGDGSLLLGTAFVGSSSTFSTWVVDAERLVEDGRGRAAALDVVGSLLVGLGAVAFGQWLGGML